MLRLNDFFCGAGGMSLGFKNSGFNIVGAWDKDKYAVESYSHNVSPIVEQIDILNLNWKNVPHSDVWTFGFPCQDISIAGKKEGMIKGKTRSGMFYEIMRLLDETINNKPEQLPSIILAENVKPVKKYIPIIKKEYEKRGYTAYIALYNSKYHGVPQNRERYFILGVHKSIQKQFIFLEENKTNIPNLSTILEDSVDEKYYISPDRNTPIIEVLEDSLKVRQATKKGYDIAFQGDSVNIVQPNSKTRRGRVGKQIAQTILTVQEQVVVLPDLTVRRFTPREYARLQGFSDDYKQLVSDKQFYKQMGNAVTVNVSKTIAEQIYTFLSD